MELIVRGVVEREEEKRETFDSKARQEMNCSANAGVTGEF